MCFSSVIGAVSAQPSLMSTATSDTPMKCHPICPFLFCLPLGLRHLLFQKADTKALFNEDTATSETIHSLLLFPNLVVTKWDYLSLIVSKLLKCTSGRTILTFVENV